MQKCRRCHRIDGNRTVDGDKDYWNLHIYIRERQPKNVTEAGQLYG